MNIISVGNSKGDRPLRGPGFRWDNNTNFVRQITPCIKPLLRKLKVAQLNQKFPIYYGSRSFIIITINFLIGLWAKFIPK
jgi:hypothetical protein